LPPALFVFSRLRTFLINTPLNAYALTLTVRPDGRARRLGVG
jgi:hypothetical protein